MQVSIDALEQCNPESLDGSVYQVHVKDNKEKSNAYWRFRGIGHLHKDCTTTLPTQDGDGKDIPISDTRVTISHISNNDSVNPK